jgi:hypothetical protein
MASINQNGYTEYRVLATLHLDMFDSASGRSRLLLLLLSPECRIKKTPPRTMHPSFPVEASLDRLVTMEHFYKGLCIIKRLHQASDDLAGG